MNSVRRQKTSTLGSGHHRVLSQNNVLNKRAAKKCMTERLNKMMRKEFQNQVERVIIKKNRYCNACDRKSV